MPLLDPPARPTAAPTAAAPTADAPAPPRGSPAWIRRHTVMFSTSIVVGAVATATDWLTLLTVVRVGMPERYAVVPGLLAGAVVQFVGNRRFTFAAHRQRDPRALTRQLWRFSLIDAATFGLNIALYDLLLEALRADFRVARAVASFVVHFGFTYPAWQWAFARGRRETAAPAQQLRDTP